MIAFKKYQIYALFTLLLTSFAGLLQSSEESALSRGWPSVSEMGTKLLQCPYTYHVAAPLALYAGYRLAPLSFNTINYLTGNKTVGLLALPAVVPAVAAYCAPTFALTELMRKQRESIAKNERPRQLHYVVPALIQSLILAGYFFNAQKDLSIIFKALPMSILLNPGIASGIFSYSNEQEHELLELENEKNEKNENARKKREQEQEKQREKDAKERAKAEDQRQEREQEQKRRFEEDAKAQQESDALEKKRQEHEKFWEEHEEKWQQEQKRRFEEALKAQQERDALAKKQQEQQKRQQRNEDFKKWKQKNTRQKEEAAKAQQARDAHAKKQQEQQKRQQRNEDFEKRKQENARRKEEARDEGSKYIRKGNDIASCYTTLDLTQNNELRLQHQDQVTNIKKAYRTLVKKWHPDRNPGSEKAAEAAFKKVNDAYERLKDHIKFN